MGLMKHTFLKKIIVIVSIFMILTAFVASPVSKAANAKTQMDKDEFYYAGTTEGAYVITQSFWDWLINFLKQVLDFLLGLFTMGGRMVFVGWAALFEEMITAMLEASAGIPMEIDSTVDPTDVDGLIDSSNNVTIEAIVYNQVPILNINLFDNKTATCISGTGRYFVKCETCYNQQMAESGATTTTTTSTSVRPLGKNQKICKMDECYCTDCWEVLKDAGYLETDSSGSIILDSETNLPIRKNNAITIIKNSVSKWYYIMRLIAMIVMLCVLIAVGIKMAISTLASDKAFYKRMIVDWIAGMILLFTIHYFMLGTIYINEVLVDAIENISMNSSSKLGKEFGSETKESDETEIGIYQEVRTRAYDPRFINGMTGTALYVTLVFLTVKFVIVYLKRYLTIIILTLLSPGVSFAYAIQKVMYGKAQAFTGWFQEYFITVFLQTVHALMYTVFLTAALEISLQSVSGIILAFVFINFMLKAEGIFRKIFRLSGGSADEAMQADKSLHQMTKTAKKAAGAMMLGGSLKNSPITKAALAPLRMARNELVLGMARKHEKLKEKNKDAEEEKNLEKYKQIDKMAEELQELRKSIDPDGEATKGFKAFMDNYDSATQVISLDGQDAMEQELVELEKLAAVRNISDEDRAKLAQLRKKFDATTNISLRDVMKARMDQFLDIDNYYEYDPKTGKRRRKRNFVGKLRFDRTKNKLVRESMSDLISEKMSLGNFLGFTDADKKILKETTDFAKGTLFGMGAMFVGLGTVAMSPTVGMGLLATGINNKINFLDKTGVYDSTRHYRRPMVDEKRRKFSFKSFNKGAKQTIAKTILTTAEKEKDRVIVQNVRKNHKALYRTLRLGGAGLVVAGAVGLGSMALAPVAMGAGMATMFVGKSVKRYSGYSQKSLIGKISMHHFKQYEAMKKGLIEDEIHMLAKDEEKIMISTYASLMESIDKLFEAQSDESEEERKRREKEEEEEEKKAIGQDEAIQLSSGKVIFLKENITDSSVLLAPDGKLKEDMAEKIIEEAVAKTIIESVISETGTDSLQTSEITNSAKKQIESRLQACGVLTGTNTKIESIITDLDSKVESAVQRITEQELSGNTVESESDKLSVFEEVLVESVIQKKAENGKIQDVSDISYTMIAQDVVEARAKIIASQSSENVVQRMQQAKTELSNASVSGSSKTNSDTPSLEMFIPEAKRAETASSETTNERTTSGRVTSPEGTRLDSTSVIDSMVDTKRKSFEQIVRISQNKEELIKKKVVQIKKKNKTVQPKTEEEKREEKKKVISALDSILEAVANGEEEVYTGENSEVYKSVDEVIQEIFDNTEEQSEVYKLIANIDKMKRYNKRAENAKISAKNPRYNKAKKSKERAMAFERYPDKIPNGDRVYTGGDGRKNLEEVETYGPITDIDALLKEISSKKRSK